MTGFLDPRLGATPHFTCSRASIPQLVCQNIIWVYSLSQRSCIWFGTMYRPGVGAHSVESRQTLCTCIWQPRESSTGSWQNSAILQQPFRRGYPPADEINTSWISHQTKTRCESTYPEEANKPKNVVFKCQWRVSIIPGILYRAVAVAAAVSSVVMDII